MISAETLFSSVLTDFEFLPLTHASTLESPADTRVVRLEYLRDLLSWYPFEKQLRCEIHHVT